MAEGADATDQPVLDAERAGQRNLEPLVEQ